MTTSSGLGDGCHVVRKMVPGDLLTSSSLDNGCQANVYVSPSGCNQVAWIHESFGGQFECCYLEVQMCIQALMQDWKVKKALSSQAS